MSQLRAAGNGESRAASQILAQQFPRERAGEQVLIQSHGARLAGAEYRATLTDLVTRLSRVRAVADVKSPLGAAGAGLISKDGRSALVTFQITGNPDTAQDRVGPALAATAAVQAAHPQLTIGEFGDASANKAINKRIAEDFQQAELTSLPVTLVILVLAFGALVAAGIPLLLGITAVAAALGLTAAFSHVMHVDPAINSVILLIGLAVGVDYSLFYLRREREERARGRTPADALQTAAATSGRAVLVSGLTVIVAMSGMFLMGSSTFSSFAVGTVLVVAISIVGSLTVLPAVLSKLGDKARPGARAVATAAALKQRRIALLGSGCRWRATATDAVRDCGGRPFDRSGDPSLQLAHSQFWRAGAAPRPTSHAGVRARPEGLPRRPAPG